MTDSTATKILIGCAISAFLVLMGLVAHMEYTEARIGQNPCEAGVRSCE